MTDSNNEYLVELAENKKKIENSAQMMQEAHIELSVLHKQFLDNAKQNEQQKAIIMQEIRKKNPDKTKLEEHNKILKSIVDSQREIADKIENISSKVKNAKTNATTAIDLLKRPSPNIKNLEEIMSTQKNVESYYLQLADALKNTTTDNIETNINKLLGISNALEKNLSVKSKIGLSSLDKLQNDYKRKTAGRIKDFVHQMENIQSKVQTNKTRKEQLNKAQDTLGQHVESLRKLDDELEKLTTTGAKIEDQYAATVKGKYKIDEILHSLGGPLDPMGMLDLTSMSKSEQKELQEITARLQEMLQEDSELAEEFPINVKDKTSSEIPTVIEKPTNVILINKKRVPNNIDDLIGAEYILALHLIMIEEIINIATRMKCLSSENIALHYLIKFSAQEFYDCNDHEFIKGLDLFSQNYINKVYKSYIKKPDQVSADFLQLAAVVAITYSNIKRMEQVCLFIKKQLVTKYAVILEEVKNKYPGIKALHEHKVLQWKLAASIYNASASQQEASSDPEETTTHDLINNNEKVKSSIITSPIVSNSIANILMKDDYDLEENLDLLVYCLKRIDKGIDKLLKNKLIPTVNYIWEYHKPSDEFYSCFMLIRKYHGLIDELIGKIEIDPKFTGWK